MELNREQFPPKSFFDREILHQKRNTIFDGGGLDLRSGNRKFRKASRSPREIRSPGTTPNSPDLDDRGMNKLQINMNNFLNNRFNNKKADGLQTEASIDRAPPSTRGSAFSSVKRGTLQPLSICDNPNIEKII